MCFALQWSIEKEAKLSEMGRSACVIFRVILLRQNVTLPRYGEHEESPNLGSDLKYLSDMFETD